MASDGAETASESRGSAFVRTAGSRLAGFLREHGPGLATVVAVLGGLMLLYAETLDLYRIITPSGSVSNAAGSVRTGADQHSWALGVMGIAGAGAAVLAWATRQRLPALAAVLVGVIALVIALAFDLPDVTASGVTTDFESGDAEAAAGFWLELVGALVLTAAAATLAALLRRAPARTPQRPRARR